MSEKEKGSIYAIKDGNENKLILDSSNICISGNFIINNEVNLKSSLVILDNSNNRHYGTIGSVLTSQGSNSRPYWDSPYYLQLSLINNFNTNTNDFSNVIIEDLSNVLYSSEANSDWDNSNNHWNCPKKGIYKIYAHINFGKSTNVDDLSSGEIFIVKDNVNIAKSSIKVSNGNNDNFIEYCTQIYIMENINENEKISFKCSGYSNTNNIIIKGKQGTNVLNTWMNIERLISL